MKTDTPQPVLLKDYTPPPFLVDRVGLDFDFRSGEVRVTADLAIRRNPAARAAQAPFMLDGEELETLAVSLDGRALDAARYSLNDTQLTIADVPAAFTLQTIVRIRPDGNTKLSGLYRSANGYFTQCEAQGFRRITWFPDRPDVMSRYTVTLRADKTALPLLLSNGNPVGEGKDTDGRHWARWEDPFPKPCYLFALVAADLEMLHDTYRTTSGREVNLAIYVEPGKLDQCAHAMAALKKSMRWDEDVFGLECDLDHYMIVAVGDFNMGAMENKGLNIFNTRYVLARPDVATDADYTNIDRVVAHEYFHNWTGNRVTCRDWFQLSLKEGLTVFRDQEFGIDTHGSISRIRDVRSLRAAQFPEDAGPMAHPVRPATYLEINNFYTATVYQKGAEVVRMIQTLIGREAFRRGMDLYFARHDGQAVTCDDFVAAMAAASGADFAQFMRWYDQAGTPRIEARGRYDAATRRYVLTLRQDCPGHPDNRPYHIPVALGLVGPDGADLPLRMNDDTHRPARRVLSLATTAQEFAFEDIDAAPVPSLLRGFSAPVVLDFPYTDEELAHLLAHDSDPFNRWEAGQRLAGRLILAATATLTEGGTPAWPASFARAAARVLALADADPAFAAEALTLPTEGTLAEQMETVDPDALHAARNGLRRFLAQQLGAELADCHERLAPAGAYRPDTADAARRALRNLCLGYLTELDTPAARALALRQFETADNMTDQFAALSALAQCPGPERQRALDDFYSCWQREPLVVNKWLMVQATSRHPDTLADVTRLTGHAAFDLRNPNKVYALLGGFGANHVRFHAADGAGYRFMAAQILHLDAINPQVAARLARSFDRWRRFDAAHQAQARIALESLRAHPGLSRDVFEIVERALA
ncbi:MAG: aminopeptidase N [Gammaproteobacteria bacterium]|nr:aminopeptidase N [Gammaproteobacteria bacterium]